MNESEKNILEIAMEIALPQSLLDQVAKKFGPQKARECAMSTSVGGIGPLLKDRILGQDEVGVPVTGITLLYENVWVQGWHEWGQLSLQKKSVSKELKTFCKPVDIKFQIEGFDGQLIDIEAWLVEYGKAKVYFLSASSNTEVVYPGPKDAPRGHKNPAQWSHEARLKQSWVLGRGALMLCKKLNLKPALTVLSETPTLFGHHRLVSDQFQNDPFFNDTKYVFNDHTPLEYAHPIWDIQTINMVKTVPSLYENSNGWNPTKKTLDVTALMVGLCEGVYGVAKKHGEVMRAMPSLKKFTDKIQYITNGVKKEEWQAPEFGNPSISNEELLAQKMKYKKKLLDWAWRHCRLWPQWATESLNKNIVIFTRRITAYKRLDILTGILKDPAMRERFVKLDVIVLVGGRIHQQDDQAQDMVYELLDIIDKNEELRNRIIFVDNFNIWEGPLLYQGAIGTVMMADDTREASATGFMKAQMNGAAVIATLDGAIPEFVNFHTPNDQQKFQDGHLKLEKNVNGFMIPYKNGQPTSIGLLEAFELFDLACKNPDTLCSLMRAAIEATKQLDISRTVNEMKDLFSKVLS